MVVISNKTPLQLGPDCDLLTDVIKITRSEINRIVKERRNKDDTYQRANDGHSLEYATTQWSILLINSLDKEMQRTVEQDAGEYSNDGVLVRRIIFHSVFISPSVLTHTLMNTLQMNTNNSFTKTGLICINDIRQLL